MQTPVRSVRPGWFVGVLPAFGVVASLLGTSCRDLECCNSCGRNYFLGDPMPGYVRVTNHFQGGDECEIGDIPRSLPEDTRTFIVRIDDVSDDGQGFSVEVVDHHEGEPTASDACESTFEDAQSLVDRGAASGETVCIHDAIRIDELCTQKACGLSS